MRQAARRLLDEGRLDDRLARGQHQLELGAVDHVGLDVPAVGHAGDRRQVHVLDDDAVEVDLGVPPAVVPGPVYAQADPAPFLDVDGVVQEVEPLDVLSVAGHRQREVPGGDVDVTFVGLVVLEDDLGAEAEVVAVEDLDGGRILSEEVFGLQLHLPGGQTRSVDRTRS